jgi:hypothetical protein
MQVTVVQLLLLVVKVHIPPLYKGMRHLTAAHIKDISITDYDIGFFSNFDAAGLFFNTQGFRRIQRDRLQSLFLR